MPEKATDMSHAIAENEKAIAVHEAVCAQRYQTIQQTLAIGEKRMARIELGLYALALVMLFGPGVIPKLLEILK